MMIMPSSVRINPRSWSVLKEIAESSGETMQAVLEKAVENYRRKWLLEKTNEAYAVLKKDRIAWQEELDEREAWEAALNDDLDGEDE